MENYTSQAHDLGLSVKFYYTTRELSNHAAELFALKSLDGEILVQQSPYVIPQTGYCHDWDCHGGAVFLHEHLVGYVSKGCVRKVKISTNMGFNQMLLDLLTPRQVDNYTACWQQGLANGEWDASACNIGTSRWFNYYANGMYWSVSQSPHVDGVYYDGGLLNSLG